MSKNPKSKNTEPRPDYPKGMKVMLNIGGTDCAGEFSHWTTMNEAYIKIASGKPYWRKEDKFEIIDTEINLDEIDITVSVDGGESAESDQSSVAKPAYFMKKPAKEFDINVRFEFMESLIEMVIEGKQVSLIITGDGGLGKTKTVNDVMDAQGLTEGMDIHTVKGYSTAKGLYNTLYENSDKLIIFDDCDEVLTNDTAKNILKGALDSYDKRVVHWISNVVNEDIPPYFEFTGKIIFISNMPRVKIPEAIRSRATMIDVSMNMDDKMKRMKRILPRLRTDIDMKMKKESYDLLDKWKEHCKDLNFRTLLKVIAIRSSGKDNWKGLAEYMILNG